MCRKPDLVVTAFGLNDAMSGLPGLPSYRAATAALLETPLQN
ncbi:MAG: hypothetical protein U0L09_07115 [Christensenellales bacterium]|nr:hypothetical protein [Christensenellales bacterium]